MHGRVRRWFAAPFGWMQETCWRFASGLCSAFCSCCCPTCPGSCRAHQLWRVSCCCCACLACAAAAWRYCLYCSACNRFSSAGLIALIPRPGSASCWSRAVSAILPAMKVACPDSYCGRIRLRGRWVFRPLLRWSGSTVPCARSPVKSGSFDYACARSAACTVAAAWTVNAAISLGESVRGPVFVVRR